MKSRWAALAGAMVLLIAAQSRTPVPDGLYFFFTPRSPGIDRISAQLSGLKARPVLLVENDRAPLPESFFGAVKSLGVPLAIVDEEGLSLARALGVSRVPCVVRVHHGRIHTAVGADLSVQEVLKCSR